MKFTKKIAALILAGLMVLSACNASDVATTTGVESPTVEIATTAEATTTATESPAETGEVTES